MLEMLTTDGRHRFFYRNMILSPLFSFKAILWSIGKCFLQRQLDFVVAAAFSHQIPYIQYTIIVQASLQNTLRRNADTITCSAERPTESSNDTNVTFEPRNLIMIGR